jgi:hypothetical protein
MYDDQRNNSEYQRNCDNMVKSYPPDADDLHYHHDSDAGESQESGSTPERSDMELEEEDPLEEDEEPHEEDE